MEKVKKFGEFVNEGLNEAKYEDSLRKHLIDFVEKKGKATWKEIHSVMLTFQGLDPDDKANRGWGSSYFSGSGGPNGWKDGSLVTKTRNDKRYLKKDGKHYVITENIDESISEDDLNENVGLEKKSVQEITRLQNAIYDLFYQVFDEEGKNVSENPMLNKVYKNLEPIITEGDDVGLQMSHYIATRMGEIKLELQRIENILTDAKKTLK